MRQLTLSGWASLRGVPLFGLIAATAAGLFGLAASGEANAQANADACTSGNTITARVVAIDQILMFNRLGAQNVNGMMYALERDVVALPHPDFGTIWRLRPDKRPRPLVLRMVAGGCLEVIFTNRLAPNANPNDAPHPNLFIDDQVKGRFVGFHPAGLELVGSIDSDASWVGKNANSTVAPGGTANYKFYARAEGAFLVNNPGATIGSEAAGGNIGNGLFGAVMVEPPGARIYRSQVTEEEMRLATIGYTSAGQPIIDYEARYPAGEPWASEGKAGLPVLNMLDNGELVHSDINAIIAGPNDDGSFPASTYPLESKGLRNPTVPNRLEAFREFASIWHDETAAAQAFPLWFGHPILGHTLHGVRDSFMINYGSGGIGSEIIANRLGVGPMHDCLDCAYEEFFLTSFTVGDPAMIVDVPANVGLETCTPDDILGTCLNPGQVGPKAAVALYPADPANVHHSYQGDFTKFRNVHAGPKEQHIFHLHNHQWLFNPNDDNSNYLDAQGIGPGSGYTYEINFGGAGNRNKTAGDAIFHCHFYPHFAQGMWYMWRIHDVMETGTVLAASGGADAYHSTAWGLQDGTPAEDARALPDGEILAGTPIPAVVPLPGKPMPPMPGRVQIVTKDANNDGTPEASVALVDRTDTDDALKTCVDRRGNPVDCANPRARPGGLNPTGLKNPGYPFWIAGIEDIVGQRPPTPPLDMLTEAEATALGYNPLHAGGFDGGLPRHALEGFKAVEGAIPARLDPDIVETPLTVDEMRLDLSKVIHKAKPVYYPEEGTDLEKVAMAYHATREHPGEALLLSPAGSTVAGSYIVNGGDPVPGAPFNEPCIDDTGTVFNGPGQFFSADGFFTSPAPAYGADNPRVYKGANIQIDAVFNKVGYHYPQQRIIALWDDVWPTIYKQKAPEPFVMRLNTYDCAKYLHANLIPEYLELDDYQVRTPTDIIGQHIHLPKWDLTTADGAANGWNYEDGTLSPGMVRERILAINHYNEDPSKTPVPTIPGPDGTGGGLTHLEPEEHPVLGAGPIGPDGPMWLGARTTIQRWFADPVVNADTVDRGLGIVFTHDHYGPSTFQQIGLYATLLVEPAGSEWVHNETGEALGTREDGGPTSWQAVILTDDPNDSYREFYFEFSDFQHAYEKGVYVGADQFGVPINSAKEPPVADPNAFRNSINPSFRQQAVNGPENPPVFPDIVRFPPFCPHEVDGVQVDDIPRPCPEAISADDPGMLVVNYRNEPIGLRVYDPNKIGPDGKPGTQADGLAGDLAYALQSRTDRAIPELNSQVGDTPYPPLTNDVRPGDPFTPIMRANVGDTVRVKIQAGAHEHEHSFTMHGVKWQQAGSGFGQALNSGWRNAQNDGISEQYSFKIPVTQVVGQVGNAFDYGYVVDAGQDGWWSGVWGIMRAYRAPRSDLFAMPNGLNLRTLAIANAGDFVGVCPREHTGGPIANLRQYDITAVLANDVLGNPLGVTIVPPDSSANMHEGAPLDPNGGTLVYNPRGAGPAQFKGPLHDPTAIIYVHTADLEHDGDGNPVSLREGVPIEPLTLRAAAGDCIEVTIRNRLPTTAAGGVPDLAGYNTLLQVVNRDRNDPRGLTTFQNNLIQPSNAIGIRPQLVAYDISRADGSVVGQNIPSQQLVEAGKNMTVQWYAGDLDFVRVGGPRVNLVATPIEFGGVNLMPADKVKQGQKGLIGALIIEPKDSTWVADADSRASATVTSPAGSFRDFAVVHQKGLNHKFGDGTAVENIASEGQGIPEDSHDAGQAAINYATEPMWYRFGLAPDTPFGNAGAGLGAIPNPEEAYANVRTGGDPVTPVFTANAGDEVRMRVLMPSGVGRGTTIAVHGHSWQRDPYICPGSADLGLVGKCAPGDVGSQAIGDNPIGFFLGGQESVTPAGHFELRLPKAGGADGVPGDYLFRDQASFGNLNGLWGILRVGPSPEAGTVAQQ